MVMLMYSWLKQFSIDLGLYVASLHSLSHAGAAWGIWLRTVTLDPRSGTRLCCEFAIFAAEGSVFAFLSGGGGGAILLCIHGRSRPWSRAPKKGPLILAIFHAAFLLTGSRREPAGFESVKKMKSVVITGFNAPILEGQMQHQI